MMQLTKSVCLLLFILSFWVGGCQGDANANERLRQMEATLVDKDRTLDEYRAYLTQLYFTYIEKTPLSQDNPVALPEDFIEYQLKKNGSQLNTTAVVQAPPQKVPDPKPAIKSDPVVPAPSEINELEIPTRGEEAVGALLRTMQYRKKGESTVLLFKQNDLFPIGSFGINPRLLPTLDSLANILRPQKQFMITVEGHADKDEVFKWGQVEDNWSLSVLRASTVVNYFIAKGVSPERLIAAGQGSYKPRVPSPSAANRRVEIMLTPIAR